MASLASDGRDSLEQVKRGLASLRHRGPDGLSCWQSPCGKITLGHARLAVIDRETGAQPISNETGIIQSVVNGEFYDYERIRVELKSRGHAFKTGSDSEILVHLYEEYGFDCVHHLRGEFAFLLWDEEEQLLLAARDRFGIKPLFFARSADCILFASEIKALHRAGITAAWDEQAYLEKLVLHHPLAGRTLFQSVSELPPAHLFIAQHGQIKQTRYWDFDFPREATPLPDYTVDQWAHELGSSLDEAVRVRMRSDVPVACYLSGGIDSASVLGLMSRHARQPVEAFCLTFADPSFDECLLAEKTAAYHHAHLHFIPVTERLLADHFEAAVFHAETIFSNAQCVAKFCLSGAVHRAGWRVVLTGEGADEIFAGYPFFVLDCLNGRSGSAWQRGQDLFLHPFSAILKPLLDVPAIRQQFENSLDQANQLDGRSTLHQSLYRFNRTVLPGHILPALGDRMEMANSVEGRLPFLDHPLVEFSRQIPAHLKISEGAEKYILRKAMRLIVPPEVCGRRKFAMQTPPFLTTNGPLGMLLQDTLRSSAVDAVPFFHKAAVVEWLDRAWMAEDKAKPEYERSLVTLLTTCLLARSHKLMAG